MSAWLIAALMPAAATAVAIILLRRSRWAVRLADMPNERSLHARPTPRLGGMGMVIALVATAPLLPLSGMAPVLATALALALASLADDVRSLPVVVRLAAHGMAAAMVVALLHSQAQLAAWSALAWALAWLAIAWMTNLFNFMDGSDGLAGGMAAIGFGAFAIAAALHGDVPLALACAALASASVGFLAHNFPPARVFMGDMGSIPLGFLAAALGLHGVAAGAWSVAFPLLVFSPFIVDATVTLARRLARRERIWIAHRSHAYQRLVLSGWSRARLALAAYALMLAASASALTGLGQGRTGQCAIISAWAVLYALFLIAVERRAPMPRAAR